jgi:hypothetical protein
MSEHLTDTQIGRYVERRGDADEIIAAAQHLDHCWECRDRTAALVDDGASDRPHQHGAHDLSRRTAPEETPGFRVLPWAILIAVALIAIYIAVRASM